MVPAITVWRGFLASDKQLARHAVYPMPDKVLSGADGVMKALEDIARKMGGGEVSVGFPEGDLYSDGTPVAAAAFWNEFGTSTIPPRPFFRPMIAKESPTWPKKMASWAKSFNYDGPKVLAYLGEDIAGALRQSIIEVNSPALSPITLMLRSMVGNKPELITGKMVGEAAAKVAAGERGATGTQAKPLNWTGTMMRAPAYSVNGGAFVKVAKD